MKKLFKAVLFAALLSLLPQLVHAQAYTLNQTTLSANITAGQTTFAVASATGITVNTNTYNTDLYIDRELMQVTSISGTTVTVIRGIGGQNGAHASGDMVIVGQASAFLNYDPSGYCNVAPTSPMVGQSIYVPALPTINVSNGAQWLCSTITHTWVPGFNNPLGESSVVTTAVASATTIVPSGPLFHLTGTTPVTTITTPLGCNATAVGGCSFTMIVDTGTASMFGTGGNLAIGAAITTLSGNAYVFTWDAKNSVWTTR